MRNLFWILLSAILLAACSSTPSSPGSSGAAQPDFGPYQSLKVTTEFPGRGLRTEQLPAAPVTGRYDAAFVYGMTDSKGKIMAEPKEPAYLQIYLASEWLAFGRMANWVNPTITWDRFDREHRTVTPTPFSEIGRAIWRGKAESSVVFGITNRREDRSFDMTVLDQYGKPISTIERVGGKTVWKDEAVFQKDGLLVVHSDSAQGKPVSRIHRLDGSPVSPFLSRVEISEGYSSVSGKFVLEPAIKVGSLDEPNVADCWVYWPISDEGLPLPLPPGAVGMAPLVTLATVSGSEQRGWAIIYSTPQGKFFELGKGLASEVLAQAGKLPRYEGLNGPHQVDESYAANGERLRGGYVHLVRRGQSWHGLYSNDLTVWRTPSSGVYATKQDVLNNKTDLDHAKAASEAAAEARWEQAMIPIRKAREAEKQAAAARAQQGAAQSAQQMAELRQSCATDPGSLSATTCFQIADQMNDAVVLGRAVKKWGARDFGDINRLKAAPGDLSQSDIVVLDIQLTERLVQAGEHAAWAQAMKNWDAAISSGRPNAAAQQNMDAFSQRIQKDYENSVRDHNDGKQNWHWGKPK